MIPELKSLTDFYLFEKFLILWAYTDEFLSISPSVLIELSLNILHTDIHVKQLVTYLHTHATYSLCCSTEINGHINFLIIINPTRTTKFKYLQTNK